MKATVGIDRGGSGTVVYVDIGNVRTWTWAMFADPTPGPIEDDRVAAALCQAFSDLMVKNWEAEGWTLPDFRQVEVRINDE